MKRIIAFLILACWAGSVHAAVLPLRQATLTAAKGPALYPYPGAAALINMLLAPSLFSNANWTKSAIGDTTFATKTLAPDGTTTVASKLTENTTATNHILGQKINRNSGTPIAGIPFRFTIDAKAAERSRIEVQISDNAQVNGVYVTWDLIGGRVGVPTNTFGSGYLVLGVGITPIGNGFYRCTFDFQPTTDKTIFINLLLDSGTGTGAQSDSYAGTAGFGLFIWQTSVLPRTAWSLKRQTFRDDFTYMSPDVNNTQGPGFNWYVGAWPNAVAGAWSNQFRTMSPTQPGDLTISSGVITMATDRTGITVGLATAAQNGAGRSFAGPGLFRCSLSFDATLALAADVSWPDCWSEPLEFLNGSATNNISAGTSEFIEVDFFEGEPSTNGNITDSTTIHDWTVTGSFTGNFNSNWNLTSIWPFAQSGWLSQHVVAVLWFPASSNNGVGMMQTYCDGAFVWQSEVDWASGAPASPGASSSNPNGIFTIGDNEHLVFILGAGPSWPSSFDFVDVWQP